MSDWQIRPYDPETDEPAVVYLWLKSFAHSPFGKGRGAHVDGSEAERTYWAEHRLVVMHLLNEGTTKVLCDPEAPGVIWAFACRSGDVVHYAVVKRRFKEVAQEMFSALFGDLLEKPCKYTHDFFGTGFRVPSSWRLNPYEVIHA